MTVNEVFEITASLIDERLDSGLVDATSTAVFKKNTPYLLTTIQDELIPYANYFKTYTITKTATTTTGEYKEYTMPSDFYSASQIVSIETDGVYSSLSDYKWQANNVLLVPDTFTGTITIVYRPIPTQFTALTDAIVLDDITGRTTMAYGLASRLLTNENRVLANYFGQLYEESKAGMKTRNRPISNEEKIIQVNDLSY